ncbi:MULTISPECIES: MarR family transcriptional regulator [unclassified Arthrobacter]|uniref:MarR family winged helix-turn-helix transcriptional regulator n=1 Tax=unclassified Arthrobacter TaxID=235627 RepID=UPI001E2F4713|nr:MULTISPECIES: MarR family transcriptional regulator [unclassified Arthrobacter]MCC9144450.1 MarR family transcriptional regulator [Arthrobacter sp. zg-Y919]MDK1275676.1 MarR family transcriptional regulator [Arthrobacter sp. zg.Y919]WIB02956.1 MarR family transcriptional regulator [Arthrobacter sp. zg-Y919]
MDNTDPAALGELMHAAFRRLRKRWMHQLAPYELTPHQFRAMNAVARAAEPEGGGPADAPVGAHEAGEPGLRLKELAERLRIAPRSATEVVDQLTAKGLMERRAHPTDRRATLLRLTDAGEKLRGTVLADRKREADEFFSVLEPGDRVELARILGELSGSGDGLKG